LNNKSYWNKKIIEWENSLKKGSNVSFVERMAAYFREPVKNRRTLCLNILKPFIKNKTVLELGCGSGFFASDLFKYGSPDHITGIDISENAIKRANELSENLYEKNKFKFMAGDANQLELPETDVTIGLGFLDYQSPDEIKKLFSRLKSKHFLFTFSEKKVSFLRCLHLIYLYSQKCPKHFYYTKKEITDLINDNYGKLHFINKRSISFGCVVHNILDQ
tara:strand:+ start:1912 stop:2568 length:657 start_codon:yes stop_codon:yes gene_type:complete